MNNLTILAIDDNRDNLTAIKAVVRDRLPGTKVLTALTGGEGLGLALEEDPDVVLLDIVMPHMDGYVVCRKFKGNDFLADIPVIFLTAIRTDLESRIRALEVGAEGFLTKPFNEIELIAQIKAMAKIKKINRLERQEKIQLTVQVAERTQELELELAERKRIEAANQVLLQETQARNQEISALMRSSRAVLENRDFEPIAKVIFEECKQQLGADAGYVALLSADGSENKVLLVDSGGPPRTLPEKLSLPMQGMHTEAYQRKETLFDNDFQNSTWMQYMPGDHMVLDNVMFAPLPMHGKVVGLIGLANKTGGFTEDDARIATGFGEIAALALANSRNLESLENSEVRFRSLVETATDAIISVDTKGTITHWNHGAERIFGYTAAETMGNNITIIIPPLAQEAHSMAFVQTLAGGHLNQTGVSREVLGLSKDGTEFPAELTLSRWQTGEGVFFTGIIRDITKRKQQEEARARLQEQLNQAQKMEAIGVLAGGIAHDFNNILSAILGYAEMARDDLPQGSQTAADLEQVLAAAERAKELVTQILSFSRQSSTDRIPVQIQPVIKEALKMLRASIPATINFSEQIDPSCGTILAESTQLHQVTMNLCSNAFHAMEKSGGDLTVALKTVVLSPSDKSAQLPPGEYVELVVSDTGSGIGPDIIDNIFDPYFTTKELGKGTGMGLSITHGIIKSYGGTITVESTLGRGTTFRAYFPLFQGEATKTEPIKEIPQGSERILFLDDEQALVQLGKVMLERLGYTVTGHTSGEEALAEFLTDPQKFDLVITDQTMPTMTGEDMARRMLQVRPELPIIICTGYSNLISEESVKIIGIKSIALKPISTRDIAVLIRNVLDECNVT